MYGNIADKDGALRNLVRMLQPGGRVVISHPEGRAVVERIVKEDPYSVTPLPTEDEAHSFLGSFGLTVRQYTDEEKLLIVVAVKEWRGHTQLRKILPTGQSSAIMFGSNLL